MNDLSLGSSPYPIFGSSILCILNIIHKPTLTLLPFVAAYSGIGYIITQDVDAGSSIATAWGIIYMGIFGRNAIKSRQFLPIATLAYIATTTTFYMQEFTA